jgi:hypothetical protein
MSAFCLDNREIVEYTMGKRKAGEPYHARTTDVETISRENP